MMDSCINSEKSNVKAVFIFLMLSGGLLSCYKENKESGIVGRYQLIEILEGSGLNTNTYDVFEPVNSEKIIEFKRNGKVISTGDLCQMNIDATEEVKGDFTLVDSSIAVDNCDYTLNFIITSTGLIISYPCIEVCKAKYKKL